MLFLCYEEYLGIFDLEFNEFEIRIFKKTLIKALKLISNIKIFKLKFCSKNRKNLIAVGFEPTPVTTGALNQRLRPLGHATTTHHQSSHINLVSKPFHYSIKAYWNISNRKFLLFIILSSDQIRSDYIDIIYLKILLDLKTFQNLNQTLF